MGRPPVAEASPARPDRCSIVELRQYALHPDARDRLIHLFERELIESQEAVGISVIGHFRDLADPNRFVWLRGFPDMPSRKTSLEAFYHGPHWKSHRDAANATIIDNDNVLLLHPARAGSGLALAARARPAIGAAPREEVLVATLYYFDAPVDPSFADFFERSVQPALTAAHARVLASLTTEYGANTFPALPVREGQHAFVWLASFRDAKAYDAHRATLARSEAWAELSRQLALHLKYRAPEVLVLSPSPRSLLPE
jgi:quinol monooxygenase YgiN